MIFREVFPNRLFCKYNLDTKQVETDSLVVWLERTETYATDMRLASHYFFEKDFTAFDALWPNILTSYNISTEESDDHDELGLVYGLLRPHLAGGGTLFDIGQTTLDSLAFWSDWCTSPGFLSRSLLRRNGVVIEQDCQNGGVMGRPSAYWKDDEKVGEATSITLYPNPADHTLTIVLGGGFRGEGELAFYSLQGRSVFKTPIFIEEGGTTIPIHSIPTGFYLIKTKLHNGESFTSKIIIQH